MALDFPALDPTAFSIGPFEVRWYALAYITGFLIGWQYCLRLVTKKSGENDTAFRHKYHPAYPGREHLDDLLTWIILGVILGGRIGYTLFYHPEYYMGHPLEIFKVWQGGMSFHGGLLGAGLAAIIYALSKKILVLGILDILSAATPIGLFLGRIANFINGELYGRPSDVPWAVVFPSTDGQPRHPSQLYEAALEGLVLWMILYICIRAYKALNRPGLVTGLFLSGYGVMRFFVEFFRAPDAHLGYLTFGLTMGQILTLPLILAGIWLFTRALQPGRSLIVQNKSADKQES